MEECTPGLRCFFDFSISKDERSYEKNVLKSIYYLFRLARETILEMRIIEVSFTSSWMLFLLVVIAHESNSRGSQCWSWKMRAGLGAAPDSSAELSSDPYPETRPAI
jgi:hypothetical protein